MKRESLIVRSTPARRLRIGPGLLLAAAAAGVLWTFVRPSSRSSGHAPLTLGGATAGTPTAPDPQWLALNAKRLNVSPAEQERLRPQIAEWQRNTATLRKRLDADAAQFRKAMSADSSPTGQFRTAATRAPAVSDDTHLLIESREAWWESVAPTFSPPQRKTIETAWATRFRRPLGGRH